MNPSVYAKEFQLLLDNIGSFNIQTTKCMLNNIWCTNARCTCEFLNVYMSTMKYMSTRCKFDRTNIQTTVSYAFVT